MANGKPSTEAIETSDIAVKVSDTENDIEARLREIRSRYETMEAFWSPIHEAAQKDDDMRAGDQWSDKIRHDREAEDRPCLTYNMLPSFTRQIVNRVRQNPAQVKINPVETGKGKSPTMENVSGTNDYAMADVYSGIVKNIEHVSRADQSYENAVKDSVEHGFGYFRLINQWSKSDPFKQELVIKRVKDSYSVLLAPEVEEVDFRDMPDAFLHSRMSRYAFEKKYPGIPYTEFASAHHSSWADWYGEDDLRLVQYYYIDYMKDEVLMLSNGKTVYLSDVEDVLDDMEKNEGVYVQSQNGRDMRRAISRPQCMWQKMTAHHILEGPFKLPFSAVPIFPVLGDEVRLKGQTHFESAIRHAHDPQKSYNYWRTSAAETVALAPKAPYLVTPQQIKGHEKEWKKANKSNMPYLKYNYIEGQPLPQRQYRDNAAIAELSNATQDAADMQSIIGLHDASLGKDGNEKSGKAINARKEQGNTATFQFPDNLSRAMEQMARLIIEAIPVIYDTQQIMRIRLPDGREDFVEINQSVKDEATGKYSVVHDIAYGKYDARIETGPSYATQRQEAADLQIELLKVLGPEQAKNIVHLIVKNLGVPGAEEVATVLRRMLPDELKSEDEKEADLPKGVTMGPQGQPVNEDGSPYQPPLTPQQQIIQKEQQLKEVELQVEQSKADAQKAKSAADTKAAEAKLAESQFKMREIEKEIETIRAGGASDNVDHEANQVQMLSQIEETIRTVMREHEENPDAHKKAITEAVAEGVLDALKRTRSYVDSRKIESSSIPAEKNHSQIAGGEQVIRVIAGADEKNNEDDKKPAKIIFNHADNGNISEAVPVYEEER
jgi:hypothetical protein